VADAGDLGEPLTGVVVCGEPLDLLIDPCDFGLECLPLLRDKACIRAERSLSASSRI
jgi:hypothetical protein